MSALLLCLGLLGSLPLQGEARLWLGEVRLVGPLSQVRFDCGEDGDLVLRADLVAGEERLVDLPFPVRSPLGVEGILAVPAPGIELAQEDSGEVAWLGWSDAQPEEVFERLAFSVRSRPRPPASLTPTRLGLFELALLGALALAALACRRRPGIAACIGLLGAVGLGARVVTRAGPEGTVTVVEMDLDADQALVVSWVVGGLRSTSASSLRSVRLECAPPLAPVHFELNLDGDLTWNTTGGPIWSLFEATVPELTPTRNGHGDLSDCWTRTGPGEWRRHGPWPERGPMPPPGTDPGLSGEGPPGWLVAGLPPGRGVLLGREDTGAGPQRWIRVVGFPTDGS